MSDRYTRSWLYLYLARRIWNPPPPRDLHAVGGILSQLFDSMRRISGCVCGLRLAICAGREDA